MDSLWPKNSFYNTAVVGAGIAGLYMLYKLREVGLSCQVVEAGADLGGTWYWNRYPGARCDTYSMEYSYSFCSKLEQEWEWSERYPNQSEILKYLNHVADRFELRSNIRFNTRLLAANFSEKKDQWNLDLDTGNQLICRFLLMATGCLSILNTPDIPGSSTFKGPIYHTSRWPKNEVCLSNQTVGMIGNGSSSVQIMPDLAKQAKKLIIFQRTA